MKKIIAIASIIFFLPGCIVQHYYIAVPQCEEGQEVEIKEEKWKIEEAEKPTWFNWGHPDNKKGQ